MTLNLTQFFYSNNWMGVESVIVSENDIAKFAVLSSFLIIIYSLINWFSSVNFDQKLWTGLIVTGLLFYRPHFALPFCALPSRPNFQNQFGLQGPERISTNKLIRYHLIRANKVSIRYQYITKPSIDIRYSDCLSKKFRDKSLAGLMKFVASVNHCGPSLTTTLRWKPPLVLESSSNHLDIVLHTKTLLNNLESKVPFIRNEHVLRLVLYIIYIII